MSVTFLFHQLVELLTVAPDSTDGPMHLSFGKKMVSHRKPLTEKHLKTQMQQPDISNFRSKLLFQLFHREKNLCRGATIRYLRPIDRNYNVNNQYFFFFCAGQQ